MWGPSFLRNGKIKVGVSRVMSSSPLSICFVLIFKRCQKAYMYVGKSLRSRRLSHTGEPIWPIKNRPVPQARRECTVCPGPDKEVYCYWLPGRSISSRTWWSEVLNFKKARGKQDKYTTSEDEEVWDHLACLKSPREVQNCTHCLFNPRLERRTVHD